MHLKPTTKEFSFNAIIEGHIVTATVSFSPAPEPGVLTEVARFEAQRIFEQMVHEEIAAGRL
jgi:hypothetical protein